jgi:glycosyltransferase involved in cell wall biosynthesis
MSSETTADGRPAAVFNGAVTLLTNFVPPYLVPLFAELKKRVADLRILVSTRMEANRPWGFQGAGLPVHVQRTVTVSRTWHHPGGFSEIVSQHLPLDTLALLRRHPPDVIVTTEFGFRTFQAVLYRAFRSETGLVAWAPVSELSEQRRGRFREALRRWILARVDAVVVTSESGARYIRKLGFPDAAIFRVPHTTDVHAFGSARAPAANRFEKRRLLYVGQLIERKAVSAFLSVLARYADANRALSLEFWVVGDGPLRGALEAQRVPENLRVTFWGNVDYPDLPSYYARAGILVFPTLADEWGVVVNEAMAAGLPVLGSRSSQAVEEMVADGETGWTFRPEDPDEIFSAVHRAISTPSDELGRMRARCRARARDFTPEAAADRMMAAIQCAAARARR